MSSSKEVKYTSRSITPPARRSRSRSSSRSRGRSHSRSQDSFEANNPGNNLYVTGLSTRVTNEDLEKYFSKEGKVQECQVVMDPRTKESRGFAFVTMETVEDANRCIKYLNRSVLEGRLMVVEKPKGVVGGHLLLENTVVPGKEEIVDENDPEATRHLGVVDDHIRGREIDGNDNHMGQNPLEVQKRSTSAGSDGCRPD